MLVSTTHDFAYLANPKTGTTSFETAFRKYASFGSIAGSDSKHISYKKFRRQFRFFANKLEIVTCVRDPLETLYSWFRYRQRPQIASEENSTQNVSFEEFVDEWAKETPRPFANVSSSVEFVLNSKGKIGDLTIFAHHISPGIHDYVAQKIGVEIPELEMNVSPRPSESFETAIAQIDRSAARLVRTYDIYNSINFANR